jgi:holo-[acyl-carrier protein] synthase
MIFGIGTDICAVARMAGVYRRHGERFAQRILTASEQADFLRSASRERLLAKRFAAKEAFSKAFGTGIGEQVGLRSVGVGHDARGKPVLEFAEPLARAMREKRLRAHVSISDERDFAVAFVVIEQEPDPCPL